MLAPHQEIAWQEWWYPVHGLGDGFEFATRDLAAQATRVGQDLQLRLLATGKFPAATCRLVAAGSAPLEQRLDLGPEKVQTVVYAGVGDRPVEVTVTAEHGESLAAFTTPLPIPKVEPPDPATFVEPPDEQLTVEQKFLKGRKFDRSTNRLQARRYYELALAADANHTASLRALAVLDLEAGLDEQAATRLEQALRRDADDGLAWYFLGTCRLRQDRPQDALACGYQAAKSLETRSLGHDLVGRALMLAGDRAAAVRAFGEAVRHAPHNARARDHWLLAQYAAGQGASARNHAERTVKTRPTELVPRALLALDNNDALERFVRDTRGFVGEDEFELIETSLAFAELGLWDEACRVLRAACVDAVPKPERSPLPLYYAAYFQSRQGKPDSARELLREAAATWRDFVFPSRVEAVEALEYALRENPTDARAHLHLGNLLANLGRLEEAIRHWKDAASGDPSLSIAFRNLGLASAARAENLAQAADYYRQAIAARPEDQTLYRDLAEILLADGKRPEAIRVLEEQPVKGQRRSEIVILLAQAYLDERRYDDTIRTLSATPYFVNWEGQDVTWRLFHQAHVRRGQQHFEAGRYEEALQDFQAALTYPENLGVGRSNKPPHAMAEYWQGRAWQALGRDDEMCAAWQRGASGSEGSDEQNEYRKRCREALEKQGRE